MAKRKTAIEGESKIQADAIKAIRSIGCNVWKAHGSGFTVPGLPDIQGFTPAGRFIGIEMKRPGEEPTSDQEFWLRTMAESNCVCGLAESAEQAKKIVFDKMSDIERRDGAYRVDPELKTKAQAEANEKNAPAMKMIQEAASRKVARRLIANADRPAESKAVDGSG